MSFPAISTTLLGLAQQRTELDFDEGLRVKHQNFNPPVVNIPGLDKGEEE